MTAPPPVAIPPGAAADARPQGLRSLVAPFLAVRQFRFASVGATCALLHLVTVMLLIHSGVPLSPANLASVAGYTLLNYTLSQSFTWFDRSRKPGAKGWFARLPRYVALGVASGGVNHATVVLSAMVLPAAPAVCLGLLAAAVVNYAVANRWVFRPWHHA